MNKIYIIIFGAVVALGFVVLIVANRTNQNSGENNKGVIADGNNINNQSQGWRSVELSDARTGEKFRISNFVGEHVIIESFAVWCPTCLKQQNEVKKMRASETENVVHIGLDTDPNEDNEKVRDFVVENDFDWLYAITPIDMTRDLIDEFGLGVVNAPQAPMIHICPDGSAEMLKRGIKTTEELNSYVATRCNN